MPLNKETKPNLSLVREWTIFRMQWGDRCHFSRKDTNEFLLPQKFYSTHTQYTQQEDIMWKTSKRVQRVWLGKVADKYACGNFVV